jgi:hypothetical protein
MKRLIAIVRTDDKTAKELFDQITRAAETARPKDKR